LKAGDEFADCMIVSVHQKYPDVLVNAPKPELVWHGGEIKVSESEPEPSRGEKIWYKMSEKLPEDCHRYLVYSSNVPGVKKVRVARYYDCGLFYTWAVPAGTGEDNITNEVNLWAEIPTPPNESVESS